MSDVVIRDKAEYHARTTDQMERHLALPPWSLRQKLALTCRILAAEGHESAIAGQITARGDRPRHLLDAQLRPRLRRSECWQYRAGRRRSTAARGRRHGESLEPLPSLDLPPPAER
jgi:hypothetical protein